jgi:hypothetical protein
LKISSAYSPPPPPGFISPMTWGMEREVTERFGAAGIAADRISFLRDTFVFRHPGSPAEALDDFRLYYGPTMNAFEAAAKNGKADELRQELVDLFARENTSGNSSTTVIPATFLRVTVAR